MQFPGYNSGYRLLMELMRAATIKEIQEVIWALRFSGQQETVPLLAMFLAHSELAVRQEACAAIEDLGVRADTLPFVLGLLESENPDVRWGLLFAVIAQKTTNQVREQVAPRLPLKLQDSHRKVRVTAGKAILALAPSVQSELLATPAVHQASGTGEHGSRPLLRLAELQTALAHAVRMLIDPSAQPGHLALLLDSEPEVRELACHTLGKRKRRDGVAAFLNLLDDPDEAVRGRAVSALAACGIEMLPSLEPITRMLHDECESVRRVAETCLALLGSQQRQFRGKDRFEPDPNDVNGVDEDVE